jgi:hypothetical protein
MAAALQRDSSTFRAWIISRRMSSWLEQQGQRPVMQRAGTLRCVGPPRPGPLLNRPARDKCSKPGWPSQAKPWSEKTGQVNSFISRNARGTLCALSLQYSGRTLLGVEVR